MDGEPNKKIKIWRDKEYDEARYAVIEWLERELPSVIGDVLIVSAGNWKVPQLLLTNPGIKSIKTFDQKMYGNTRNNVDFYGDICAGLPADWTDKWDCLINNQAMECYENPFKAMDEMFRVLKLGGTLYIDCPFNYRWFGSGSWTDVSRNKKDVKDYWRITNQGWVLLTKKFTNVKIERSGPERYDPYSYMIRAVK